MRPSGRSRFKMSAPKLPLYSRALGDAAANDGADAGAQAQFNRPLGPLAWAGGFSWRLMRVSLLGRGFRSFVSCSIKRRRTLSPYLDPGSGGTQRPRNGGDKVFEPLGAHAGLSSRRAFYEASQMGLPALPSWDEAEASWLAALNSLGRVLGWSQIDSLGPFNGCLRGDLIHITGSGYAGQASVPLTRSRCYSLG